MSENEKDKKKDIKPEPTLKVTLGGEKYDSHAILNNSLKLSENSILSADPYKVENKFTTLAGELYSKSIINNINFEKDNLGLLNYKPKYLEDAVLKISGASDFSKYINSGLSSASAITQSILYAQPTTIVAEARKINNQKNETEDKIKNLQTEILQVKNNQKEKDTKIKELESELEKYRTLSQYQNLLTRVGALAKEELIVNEELRNNFSNNSVRPGAVISIDIRNSTELMLLAKSPVDFAQFITSLILVLEKIVKDNFGIFDKFTGDGLLAFFPDFFCGKDSLYFALQTAKLCQNAFSIEYEKHLDCFDTIKADVGLGIGIDYGNLCFATISDDLTVVGKPVVYACRYGGAPAGHTYINQGAMSKIKELYWPNFSAEKILLNIKNQGPVQGYEVVLNFDAITPDMPDWYIAKKGTEDAV